MANNQNMHQNTCILNIRIDICIDKTECDMNTMLVKTDNLTLRRMVIIKSFRGIIPLCFRQIFSDLR